MSEHVECPACGKRTVVQREDNIYQCLNCDFKKDFSEPPLAIQSEKSENPFFWTSVILTLVALLFLQARHSTANNANLEIRSSQSQLIAPAKVD